VPQADDDEEESIIFSGEAPVSPKKFQIFDCPELPNCRLGVVRGLLSPTEVAMVSEVALAPNTGQVQGQGEDLTFKTRTYRLEKQLRLWRPKLFSRLVNTAWAIDSQLWRKIGEGYELYPQLELNVYDAPKNGGAHVRPCCDTDSAVSVIVLLSDCAEFKGGVCYFDDGTETGRKLDLQLGDAVFFTGEDCEHWITPVTTGRRAVLQLELDAGHKCWDRLMLAWFCSVNTVIAASLHIYALVCHPGFWLLLLVVLAVSLSIFGSRQRLPPSIRCSKLKQAGIVLSMVIGFAALVCTPSALDVYYGSPGASLFWPLLFDRSKIFHPKP